MHFKDFGSVISYTIMHNLTGYGADTLGVPCSHSWDKSYCTDLIVLCFLQFAQIAEGLGKAKVVLACVSKQYANSENCRMEIQFAIKVNAKTLSFLACLASVSVEFLYLFRF